MASKPSKYREIPVAQVHEGCWVKYRILDVVYQGTLELFLGSALVLREGAEVTPLFSRGVDGKFHYAPHVYMEDLHVYEPDDDEEDKPAGDDVIGDVGVPEPEPPCHVGDWVRLKYDINTAESEVITVEPCTEDDGVWHVYLKSKDEDCPFHVGSDWTVEKVTPRFDGDGLPNQKGFYKAATGSVWKWDGKLFAPVLDHDGNPAPATPVASMGRDRFRQESGNKHRFPFVKVSLTVDEA